MNLEEAIKWSERDVNKMLESKNMNIYVPMIYYVVRFNSSFIVYNNTYIKKYNIKYVYDTKTKIINLK